MKIAAALDRLLKAKELSGDEMTEIMRTIMSGGATPAQIGGFLMALRAKGESVGEVVAAAKVLREMATLVSVGGEHLVDTCGTGGDGAHTFNISTASAFVVAAAGGRVAKHGSRSVSGNSGSADVLEAAGININLTPSQVGECIEVVGLGFLFAQRHHDAMQHANGPRRELGVRTLFNLLGPLTNPAGAVCQLLGVFSGDWLVPMAEALRELGSRHVLVVHSDDGLDEISIGAVTRLAELKNGEIVTFTIEPEHFGFARRPLELLAVASPKESFAVIQDVFSGKPGPAKDIVILNAGAALYVADVAETLEAGMELAAEAIGTGAALGKLLELRDFTRRFQVES